MTPPNAARTADVVIVGGGQAALALAYYLRRTSLSFVVLDAETGPGGAWRHTWDSLRLFSPAQWSSLPGRPMPGGTTSYPSRDEALAYLAEYETRYRVPVVRPVRVTAIRRATAGFVLDTTAGPWAARAVVSATGTWSAPNVAEIPGRSWFRGVVLHSAAYRSPQRFADQSVVVVGGGNSGAQLVADLADVARVAWATRRPPTFLPDAIDGRYLFEEESARYRAVIDAGAPPRSRSLGDIVMVEPVRRARDRGALEAVPMFTRFTNDGVEWPDGTRTPVDAVILATGFRPALAHLESLGVIEPNGHVLTRGTRSVRERRLWLVGYGDWTGFASATLIGVGRSARRTVEEIAAELATALAPTESRTTGTEE